MKMIWQSNLIFIVILLNTNVLAQIDSSWQQKPQYCISGFADVFYAYDFNQPIDHVRQSFLYNHNRHNEFNLNLGFVKFNVKHSKYSANLALQTGTYANDNYAAEPGTFKSIQEANIGVVLNKKSNLWMEAGIMPSHIGFESAISMDNWTLTRSLLAENSPYFSTGAKLTFKPNVKWEFSGLILNGWQRIQKLKGNSMQSMGTQLTYVPTQNVNLNWSVFIGTDDPDSTRRMRYFNNFYGKFQINEKCRLITGFDIGIQQKEKNSFDCEFWLSPVIIGQYSVNKNWKTAIRAEYYQDDNGIIVSGYQNGFKTSGFSLNFDYSPNQFIVCRIEGRWLCSRNQIFKNKGGFSNNNFIVGSSIAIKFSDYIN